MLLPPSSLHGGFPQATGWTGCFALEDETGGGRLAKKTLRSGWERRCEGTRDPLEPQVARREVAAVFFFFF